MEDRLLDLAAARGAAAEVFGRKSVATSVVFRAGELHSQTTHETHGFGLRVLCDGRMGFASGTNPSACAEVVDAALATAALGRTVGFGFPEPAPAPPVATSDNRVVLLPTERMIEWGRDLVEAVRSRVPDMKLDVELDRGYHQLRVLNTNGVNVAFDRASLDLTVTGLLVLADGLFWIGDYVNLSDGKGLELEPVADRLTLLARHARRKAAVAAGAWPAVVMPTALRDLFAPLLVGANGKQREKGTTPLLGRENAPILDRKLTLVDNPLRPYGMVSGAYDGEGVPRRQNVLFDKGVFCRFFHDTATAAACGTVSTGSASRDYSSVPQPGATNTELAPGATPEADMIRQMAQGLLIHDFIGGGQSNLLAGEVALSVACGYKVEQGEVVGRVKDVVVAGNVYELLADVAAVGDTPRDLGNFVAPPVMFSGLKVAAK